MKRSSAHPHSVPLTPKEQFASINLSLALIPYLRSSNEQYQCITTLPAPAVAVPKPKPKRPLSAYNLFFQRERKKLLEDMPTRPEGKPRRSHGKIGFAELARTVSAKWKVIDPATHEYFEKLAAIERQRYKKERTEWKKEQARFLAYASKGVGTSAAHPSASLQLDAPDYGSFCMSPAAAMDTSSFPCVSSLSPPSDVVPFSQMLKSILGDTKVSATLPHEHESNTLDSLGPDVGTVGSSSSCVERNSPNPQESLLTPLDLDNGPSIAELAQKLDDESVELFCNMFR